MNSKRKILTNTDLLHKFISAIPKEDISSLKSLKREDPPELRCHPEKAQNREILRYGKTFYKGHRKYD